MYSVMMENRKNVEMIRKPEDPVIGIQDKIIIKIYA